MNNKETLIKTLRGSVAQLNELSDMTEGIDVYDAAGYVDTEFLMEALSCVNTFMDASNMVITKISSLLAPDAPVDERKNQLCHCAQTFYDQKCREDPCTVGGWY